MKGADEYYNLLKGKSQQIGRLFFRLHTHARGKCLEVYVLPEGRAEKGDRISNWEDVVEVYGMVSGQRGWTESYGWIHKGVWQSDFDTIMEQKKRENESEKIIHENNVKNKKSEESEKTSNLLSNYK